MFQFSYSIYVLSAPPSQRLSPLFSEKQRLGFIIFWIFLDFCRHIPDSDELATIAPEISWNQYQTTVTPSIILRIPGWCIS